MRPAGPPADPPRPVVGAVAGAGSLRTRRENPVLGIGRVRARWGSWVGCCRAVDGRGRRWVVQICCKGRCGVRVAEMKPHDSAVLSAVRGVCGRLCNRFGHRARARCPIRVRCRLAGRALSRGSPVAGPRARGSIPGLVRRAGLHKQSFRAPSRVPVANPSGESAGARRGAACRSQWRPRESRRAEAPRELRRAKRLARTFYDAPVIRSFADKATERLSRRESVPAVDPRIRRTALRKLRLLDSASSLEELRVPPGNRLERLKGDRSGQYSIRINDRWRICFRWSDAGPEEVEIVDYH